MRVVALGAVCLLAFVGSAAGSAPPLRPTLSFVVDAGVSSHGFEPLGGGICVGNRRVTEPRPDSGIAWSPDGSRVAFYRQMRLGAHVLVADADGRNLRNLTPGGRATDFNWAPDWSPDGSRIVYLASDQEVTRLVTVRPDGSDKRVVPGPTGNATNLLRSPKWSPDGTWIGYTLNDGIHVVRADGSGDRLLLANAEGPDWSPDGRRIVFTRDRDLALANSDGTGVAFVTRTPRLHEGGAQWSPDGSQMVYVAIDETDPKVGRGPGDHMHVADANGRNRRELRGLRGVVVWSPAWRPAAPPSRGARPCALLGTPRDDVLTGTAHAELIYGRGGNDVIRGRGGDDIIVGDVPFARARGRDRLFGGPGRDFIDSYDGRGDLVHGGAGRDRGVSDRHDRLRSVESYG
jgi:dipeptidyl aminopeptidase/acylaminoacyl peptidase